LTDRVKENRASLMLPETVGVEERWETHKGQTGKLTIKNIFRIIEVLNKQEAKNS